MRSFPFTCKSRLAALALALCAATSALAQHGEPVTGDRGSDMAVDLIVVRPLGVVATVLGTVGFVLALPFTLPSGNAEESACEWIATPLDYTFKRPLGDFDRHRPPRCNHDQ